MPQILSLNVCERNCVSPSVSAFKHLVWLTLDAVRTRSSWWLNKLISASVFAWSVCFEWSGSCSFNNYANLLIKISLPKTIKHTAKEQATRNSMENYVILNNCIISVHRNRLSFNSLFFLSLGTLAQRKSDQLYLVRRLLRLTSPMPVHVGKQHIL